MSSEVKLDLERGSVTAFARNLLDDPRRIRALPEAIVDVETWRFEIEARVDALVRAATRQLMRRGDDLELVEDILAPLRLSAELLETRSTALQARVATCADLAEDLLAERRDFDEASVLARKHVPEILEYLASEGQAYRGDLKERFDLEDANLTRIVNAMEAAGLVRRRSEGREKVIRPTRSGYEAAKECSRPVALPNPAVTTGTGKVLQVFVPTSSAAEEQALLYAREMGLTEAFQIELHHRPLNSKQSIKSQIEALYSACSDPDNYSVVVHAAPPTQLSAKAQRRTIGIFNLATYTGTELLASREIWDGADADWSASLNARADRLMRLGAELPGLQVCQVKGDIAASKFAEAILVLSGAQAGAGKTALIRNMAVTSNYWKSEASADCLDVTTLPGFDEWLVLSSGRRPILNFLDLEQLAALHTGDAANSEFSKHFRDRFAKLFAGVELSELVNHWVLSASLDRSAWERNHAPSFDIATRLYWFSSVLATNIRRNVSEFSGFVAHAIAKRTGAEPGVMEPAVKRDFDRHLRIAAAEDYLREGSADRLGKYHWSDRARETHLAWVVKVHEAMAGETRSRAVSQLSEEVARIRGAVQYGDEVSAGVYGSMHNDEPGSVLGGILGKP